MIEIKSVLSVFRVSVPNENKFDKNRAEALARNKIRLEKRSQYSDHTYLTCLHKGECYSSRVGAWLFSVLIKLQHEQLRRR